MVERNGHLCWQMDRLWEHVLKGHGRKAGKSRFPWALIPGGDYVLLDQAGQVLGILAYRDSRTQGMDAKLEQTMPFHRVVLAHGHLLPPFNTVYQLMAAAGTAGPGAGFPHDS